MSVSTIPATSPPVKAPKAPKAPKGKAPKGKTNNTPRTLTLTATVTRPVIPARVTATGVKIIGQIFDALSECDDAQRAFILGYIVDNAHNGADAVKEARINLGSVESFYGTDLYGLKILKAWKSPLAF